jgi:hypothetical protein
LFETLKIKTKKKNKMKVYKRENSVESLEAIYQEWRDFEHYFAMGVDWARYWNRAKGQTYLGPPYWYLTLNKNRFGSKSISEVVQIRVWQDDGTVGFDVDIEDTEELINLIREREPNKEQGER